MSRLSVTYRLALNRRFREGAGHEAIAAELGLDLPQTRNVLRKAMMRLRILLARRTADRV